MSPQNIKNKILNKNKKKNHSFTKTKKDNSTNNTSNLTLSPNFSSYVIPLISNRNSNSPILKNNKKYSFINDSNLEKIKSKLLNKNNSQNFSPSSVDSFQIKRSYKNLNQVSGGTYIKNKKLQSKIIKMVKDFDKKKNPIKKKEKSVKSKLTDNLNIKSLLKSNKDDEIKKNKTENNNKSAKTKGSNILSKKKKKNNSNKKSIKIESQDSPENKEKKKQEKLQISNNTLLENTDNNNSSIAILNSFIENPDDTFAKLNQNNKEMIKDDFKEGNPKLKKENKVYNNEVKKTSTIMKKK